MGARSAGDRPAASATSASSSSSSGSTSPNHTRLFLNAPATYVTYLSPCRQLSKHLRTSALRGAGNTMAIIAPEVTAYAPGTSLCPISEVVFGAPDRIVGVTGDRFTGRLPGPPGDHPGGPPDPPGPPGDHPGGPPDPPGPPGDHP